MALALVVWKRLPARAARQRVSPPERDPDQRPLQYCVWENLRRGRPMLPQRPVGLLVGCARDSGWRLTRGLRGRS